MARTKILLKEAVDELGVAGDVCTVARGYARNYLVPNGLAVWATKSALKQATELRRIGLLKLAKQKEEAVAQAEVIRGRRLLFTANAGDTNRLYGSITQTDITERIATETEISLDRRSLLMEGPIRSLGVTPVRIRLMQGVESFVEIGVVREDENWDNAEEYRLLALKAAEEEAAAEEPDDAGPELQTDDEEIQRVLDEVS